MVDHGTFCTVINCMDGRTQRPALDFLEKYFGSDYVDSVTEPGPVAILAERNNTSLVDGILRRVDISVHKHGSNAVAIVAHHDCAGNPLPKEQQFPQLRAAVLFLRSKYPQTPVIGLWIGEDWKAELLSENA